MSRLGLIIALMLAFLVTGAADPDAPPRPPADPSPATSGTADSGTAGPGTREMLAAALPLIFDSEWIRLHVSGDSLEVRGTYWLFCHRRTERGVPLIYPFPEDSLLGGARMVSVSARAGDGPAAPLAVDLLPGLSGVRWRIPACTADTIAVEAIYRQKIHKSYARYIVTTTRAWDRPLRRARFEIHLPPGATPLQFSFPFVRQERAGGVFYTYEAESFLPDRDITVTWEE